MKIKHASVQRFKDGKLSVDFQKTFDSISYSFFDMDNVIFTGLATTGIDIADAINNFGLAAARFGRELWQDRDMAPLRETPEHRRFEVPPIPTPRRMR